MEMLFDEDAINKQQITEISLELGDIIEIIAPENPDIHEMTAIIHYIDESKITLIDTETLKHYQLNVDENQLFSDETIQQVNLLSRSDEKGYARQNGLLPRTWIDIHFGGEIPLTITGEITNLEEDMIEITSYPDLNIFYIDFAYKGIPEDVPIEKIVVRDIPSSIKKLGTISGLQEGIDESVVTDVSEPSVTYLDNGESIIKMPENATPDKTAENTIQEDSFLEADDIIFGEKLGAIQQYVELPESQKRYDIDTQVNHLMDELLSTIPNSQRTVGVLDNLHLLIERFKQLREKFSKFDANEDVYEAKINGAFHKPMLEKMEKLAVFLRWFIPVVSNRKKIYNVDVELDNEDIVQEKIEETLVSIENAQTEYYKNISKTRTVTYISTEQRINNIMTPFEEPFDKPSFLTMQQIQTNMECVVDNLNDFYSTVIKDGNIHKKKFVIQRYHLGSHKIAEQTLKSGKKIYKRMPLTQNETVAISSFLMLPMPVVQFSKIDMAGTNILERANLHHAIFSSYRLLKKNLDVVPHVIDDLKKEFDYEKMETDSRKEFLSTVQEFVLHDDVENEADKYSKFLECIIPKTRTFIRLVRKYIRDKLSFRAVVQYLEPFCIKTADITYQQYNEIRYFVKEKITKTKTEYVAKRDKLFSIISAKYNVPVKLNAVFQLLTEKKELLDALYISYPFLTDENNRKNMSSQEVLYKILTMDKGNLQCNLITSLLLCLMTPHDMMDILKPPKIDEMTDVEKIQPADCHRRYLTKRYDSLAKLQKDNNTEDVYYDSEFDDSPYDIVKKYKDQQKSMAPDKFFSFLKEALIQKHECPPELAEEMAATLIEQRKKVQDGEYAVVELKLNIHDFVDKEALNETDIKKMNNESSSLNKLQYYRRLKNNWINDKEINDEVFLDTNTLFCNISKDCFKNRNNNVCETTNNMSEQLAMISKKKLLDEFDKRYAVDVEELERTLESALNQNKRLLKNLYHLNDVQSKKANNLAYELGKLANSNEDQLSSPYLNLRDKILEQEDFAKKQYDIVRFVEKFCREPMVAELEENQHWKYCLETNTKLIPGFLYDLALEFTLGGDYSRRLDEICRAIGELSQDGDAYVDKHSGYIICKIDYSNEEGYDDSGFKVTTHAVLEKDLGVALMNIKEDRIKEDRVFDSANSETVYNVFRAICSNIDIQIEGIEDFVLSMTDQLMAKVISKESVYNARSEKQLKEKGKGLQPYQNYFKEMLILTTVSVIFVSIQTAVPSFKTNKTFPGCVRSFSGYPLDGGIEDMTGLKYMSCVVEKTSSKISPWDAIQKLKTDEIMKRMKNITDAYILKRADVNELYVKKREYILLYPELISVEEHSVSKWSHFLPPVVDFSITKTIKTVGEDFNKDILDTMRKGHRDQHHQINILHSRASHFGFSVIERINHIVKSKEAILKTSAQIPFMENACCNEDVDVTKPILYFIKEDENIRHNIKAAANMSLLLNNIRELSTASFFFHNEFTGIKYPQIRSTITENNIYSAVVKYCNFDRNLPVPEKLKTIVTEKPAGYNLYWSIEEKIEYLKKNGKRFTVESLHQLMKMVAENNIVTSSMKKTFTRIQAIQDINEALNIENSSIIDDKMREHLRNVFEEYDPRKMMEEESKSVENFADYIYSTNEVLYNKIMGFFETYGNLSSRDYEKLNQFLFKITDWDLHKTNSDDLYYDDELYTITQYMQNVVLYMSKIYPTILLNDAQWSTVPNHWGFQKRDPTYTKIQLFIEKHYESIEKFKNDKIIGRLLREAVSVLVNLNLFTQNIPVITPIKKAGHAFHSLFDKKTTYMILAFCFYSVINTYIDLTSDAELLRADLEEFKVDRRAKNAERRNASSSIRAELSISDIDLIETSDELQEYKIQVGNTEELKTRVCELLLGYLQIEDKNKKAINLSYDKIIQQVRRGREKEKKSIVQELGKLSKEERRVEDMLKNFKIGRWNVGQQKGLVAYDADTNERETKDMIGQMLQDMEEENVDANGELMMDVYDLATLTNAEKGYVAEDLEVNEGGDEDGYYDAEGDDIGAFGDRYLDGVYYDEDRDDDFGYDDDQ
jgi:hypothetical protein